MLTELNTPVARRLLSSTIPARLAFVGSNGQPHVTPIWFLWRDEKILMCSADNAAKVRAIRRNPRIALTIDSEQPPYQVLRVRGRAELEPVEGIPEEYEICAHRYYGPARGEKWLDGFRAMKVNMVRIGLTPDWAEAADFQERFPHLYPSDSK